jgi:hypothetical protein
MSPWTMNMMMSKILDNDGKILVSLEFGKLLTFQKILVSTPFTVNCCYRKAI